MPAEASAPRVAIVGAGAIGGWLADALDLCGWRVSVVARAGTLGVIRARGLTVVRGAEERRSHPAAGMPADFGTQDYVMLAVKAHQLPSLAAELVPLLGAHTTVVSAVNGIPWWFCAGFSGPLEGAVLRSVDPDGTLSSILPARTALGAVVHASARVRSPGVVEVVAAERLLLGEPSGAASPRVRMLVEALRAGGINASVSQNIRDDIWAKLWGNMNMNPLSALARSGTARLLGDPDVRHLCSRMMLEMQECGRRLGLGGGMTADERIAVTRRLGDFKTSMLLDAEAGRAFEVEPQLGAVVEIAERLAVPVPYCRSILGLTRLLSAAVVEQRSA